MVTSRRKGRSLCKSVGDACTKAFLKHQVCQSVRDACAKLYLEPLQIVMIEKKNDSLFQREKTSPKES